ncbi:DNA ligase [Hydrogenophaga pseudoflava]|uniref:DNA ligase n=1 Tax=Hydrogenophaga pseudoflava TaxID=47421 RepID=UPI0027E50E35|nr:DNA ligase [Hydrogenophaga pseudoflava]MDQ7746404.1 DNA ligase [Hydrogenophaga pseudoflava]
MNCTSRRRFLAALAGAFLCPVSTFAAEAPPALMLAGKYRPGLDLSAYWVSEKFDGVRGYWDGQRLWTRGGEPLSPPDWFIEGWPATPMDGELWAGRGHFEEASGTVRQRQPDDQAWRRIRFMVFDLPAHPGVFDERMQAYHALLQRLGCEWVVAVPQEKVTDHASLQRRLKAIVRAGAEGLMLHRGDSLYRAVRGDDLVKLKPFDDAEAKVLSYVPGKGRHAGRMGALWVETPEGLRFRLGSGFTDAQRERPPSIGSWVTYRHHGLHDSGLPRFAAFLRERPDFRPQPMPTPP